MRPVNQVALSLSAKEAFAALVEPQRRQPAEAGERRGQHQPAAELQLAETNARAVAQIETRPSGRALTSIATGADGASASAGGCLGDGCTPSWAWAEVVASASAATEPMNVAAATKCRREIVSIRREQGALPRPALAGRGVGSSRQRHKALSPCGEGFPPRSCASEALAQAAWRKG